MHAGHQPLPETELPGDRHWHRSRWAVTTLWLLLLMGLTLALERAPWRYQVVTDSLLNNLDFSQAARGWALRGKRQSISLHPGTPAVLALQAEGIGRNVLISRFVTHSSQNFSSVRISAELSSQNLRAGPLPWQRGRLILLSVDARGKRIWYWPQQVAALEGTRAWRSYQREIPLNTKAAQTWLVLYISADSGKLLMKNLDIKGITETDAYQISRSLIIGTWVLSGLWMFFSLLPTVRNNLPALISLMYALLLLAGGMTPQPQLHDSISSGRQSIQQLVAAGAALFPDEPQPPATQIASSEQPPKPVVDTPPASEGSGELKSSSPTAARASGRGSNVAAQLRSAGSDKRMHLIAFAALSFIVLLAFRAVPKRRCLLSALLLGAAIETLQTLSITREPEWVDLGFDAAGVFIGAVFALLVIHLVPGVFSKTVVTPPG